jgi:hypothetical protein
VLAWQGLSRGRDSSYARPFSLFSTFGLAFQAHGLQPVCIIIVTSSSPVHYRHDSHAPQRRQFHVTRCFLPSQATAACSLLRQPSRQATGADFTPNFPLHARFTTLGGARDARSSNSPRLDCRYPLLANYHHVVPDVSTGRTTKLAPVRSATIALVTQTHRRSPALRQTLRLSIAAILHPPATFVARLSLTPQPLTRRSHVAPSGCRLPCSPSPTQPLPDTLRSAEPDDKATTRSLLLLHLHARPATLCRLPGLLVRHCHVHTRGPR